MLELKGIDKKYKDFSIKNIDLQIEKGDYFVLLGASGAGKSLILEIIAGIIRPDKGSLWFNNQDITQLPIQQRPFGIVFQDYAIFPHLTVFQNIAYSLKKQKLSKAETQRLVSEQAAAMNVDHLLHRSPNTLSGGEKQRVALARTLIAKPEILLLDEPLSALDIQLQADLRQRLKELHRQGQTIVHVTHNYNEAIALSNKIGIIQGGEILQAGEIHAILNHPKNKFVADFTGHPNFFEGKLVRKNDQHWIEIGKHQIFASTNEREGEGSIFVRNEDITIYKEQQLSSARNNLKGVIVDIVPYSNGVEVKINADGLLFVALITQMSVRKLHLEIGKTVWLSFKASAVKFYKN